MLEKSVKETRIKSVAAIAAEYAGDVDENSRFPREAIDAMKAEHLLSMQIPRNLGGGSASLAEVAEVCSILGQVCASSAMIFAMHQAQVAGLIAHSNDSAWHTEFMRRISVGQLLIASATSEAGVGGSLRNSLCAMRVSGDRCRLSKDATVISYGSFADAIMVTSRIRETAAANDQILTVFDRGQYTVERTLQWNALGMRGTCSDGFLFEGEAAVGQIFSAPFAEISARSLLPTSHILWSAVWYGIASDAVVRAQKFVRAEAPKRNNIPSPLNTRLAEAASLLQAMRSTILSALKSYEASRLISDELSLISLQVSMNELKVFASDALLAIIDHAMMICGIIGYRNDTPFSLGRHLRDAHSARLMISNDRILDNTSHLLLIERLGPSLSS